MGQRLVTAGGGMTDQLRGSDRTVLGAIEKSGVGMTFQALRRATGLHQESLARSLKRLEEIGAVERREDHYFASRSRTGQAKSGGGWYAIVEGVLPYGFDKSIIIRDLRGRWFKNLRWYGADAVLSKLVWTNLGGSVKIALSFKDNDVMVSTDAATLEKVAEAILMAYQLFARVSEICSSASPLAAEKEELTVTNRVHD